MTEWKKEFNILVIANNLNYDGLINHIHLSKPIYDFYNKEYQTEEECIKIVKQCGYMLCFVKEQTQKICLEAVKQKGFALQYVIKQTNKICLKAVKEIGSALENVYNQTDEICLEAVKQDGLALEFVNDQTNEICLEAESNNIESVKYIKDINIAKQKYLEKNEILEILPMIYQVLIKENKELKDLFNKTEYKTDLEPCPICSEEKDFQTHYSCHINHILCLDCWLKLKLEENEKCVYCRKVDALNFDTLLFIKKIDI